VTDWRLLSLLLQYPDEELLEVGDRLPAWMRTTGLAELQAEYVRTFDFDRRASLHLTYHTHGDRRQRGLELVRLKRRYAEAGLPLTGTELPDYLPVLLEFAALRPAAGERLLAELRTPIELVRSRLHRTGSAYAELFDELADVLPRPTRAQVAAARKLAREGPPTELVGLEPFAAEVAS
jgi:nitrate reductase molybdenum cofactor assembly chaperone NarJ/NarW